MKIKRFNSCTVALIFFISSSLNIVNAKDMTGSAGIINGTAPVIYNDKNEAGKVSFTRVNETMGVDDELDVTDIIKMSWKTMDAEGDEDATLPTVEWICTDTKNATHV
ncbi:MAG: hypothetical protein E7B34_24300, partial [Hafnia alvei]|nr:hypothetical protein [Hafnia alvei]